VPQVSERPFTAKTPILLTPTNLIGVIALVAAVIVAWTKMPTHEDVTQIAKEASTAAMAAAQQQHEKTNAGVEAKIEQLDRNYEKTGEAIDKLSSRIDYMLIMLAGSSAEDFKHSPRARQAAERVRRNLAQGNPPLEGLPLDP